MCDEAATNQVYNIAFGERTTLNSLYQLIKDQVVPVYPAACEAIPKYRDFRVGDVRHSFANFSKAMELLGYAPEFSVRNGLFKATAWYQAKCGK